MDELIPLVKNMGSKEKSYKSMMTQLYLGPAPKSAYRSGIEAGYLFRPNDKPTAVDMNKQGSGEFSAVP